jgi:rubrerythrin
MDSQKYLEIIAYAIDKEYEAAQFYGEMQLKVRSDASIEMLIDLEKMELNHAKLLENLKMNESVMGESHRDIQNLQLSDYMVEPVDSEHITYQEILVIAMKKEEAAKNLYLSLANDIRDEDAKKMLNKLAAEEARHKLMLEKIYEDEVLKEN